MSGQPFSWRWVWLSVLAFTGIELLLTFVLLPALFVGRFGTPMLEMRMQMIMHLGSFVIGGALVGLVSPGVRLWEPAVGAAISVLLVFSMALFMPMRTFGFTSLNGWGIVVASVLAIVGAYSAEKFMGNVEREDNAAGKLRNKMWGDDGVLSGDDKRWLAELERSRSKQRS